ncbi:hypothetical protein EDB81DRAFT_638038 [Dactylonectria macrodidyma]|uniref:NmrA-like domain-containing protein n=1 Tax=Dactylonectria macrodidyma TaxID=307937 RepID=A0A9P9JNM7_9HYPO|nr:hypothetical protein EDB81DRAFT_638038 [Dactylonectria macrodidyma]
MSTNASNAPTAFITAATGAQGLAVARQLRGLGWAVRTTARNMDAPAVHQLQALGVEVMAGDWDNETVLTTVILGCSCLFLNLMPNLATFSSEVPHAKRILAIATAADVKHVVYSSALSVKNLGQGQYYIHDSPVARAHGWKQEIEALVRGAGFETWTILRGGFFMVNFLAPKVNWMYPNLVQTNTWTTAYTPEVRMPMVDVEDIAKFAVAAFRDPARFHQQEIEIASELLSPDQIIQQLGDASGRTMRNVFLTSEEVEEQRDTNMLVTVQLMSRDLDKCVDFAKVKSWGIPLGTFQQFLKREHNWVRETYP